MTSSVFDTKQYYTREIQSLKQIGNNFQSSALKGHTEVVADRLHGLPEFFCC